MFDNIQNYQVWENKFSDTGFLRSKALSGLIPSIGNKLIKVICGQRRCGKSFLMRQLINLIFEKKIAEPSSILYLNMEYKAFAFIKNGDDLFNLTQQFRKKTDKQKSYLFIDEVQKINRWEEAVNSLAQDFTQEWEIIISGSNASLLSGELSSLLSGRYLSYTLFPFSYTEYCGITGSEPSQQSFIDYMYNGGMPECFKLSDENLKKHYISDLKDSIVLRDIVQRHQIREIRILDKLIDLLIDSVGSYFSVNNISKTFKASGIKTNAVTIGNYIEFLKDVFFIHEAPRYDIEGRKILSGERKYYINDLSFKYNSSFSGRHSPGKFLENTVFLHLLREGYGIHVGSVKGKEIDFVAKKNDSLHYIQTTYILNSDEVIAREFGNLEKISDNHKKIVVSLDPVSFGNIKGIEHVQAWNWVK